MLTPIFYKENLGNISNSDGLNDFLLASSLPYSKSLATFKNKYIPYYIQHNSLDQWEIGLGIVIDNLGQDVLVRSGNVFYPDAVVYSSSNNNQPVVFSAGSKTVKSVISEERINHGGNNFISYSISFTADAVQTTYGVLASGSPVTAQLPSASGNQNLILSFRVLPGSNNNVIISASGLQKIDGSPTVSLTPTQKYTSLISDGSTWYQLNREVEIDAAGVPVGSAGNIQFKTSSTEFGGTDSLHWDQADQKLMLGGATSPAANIILPASSGQNLIFNNQAYDSDFQVKGTGNNQLFFDASSGRLGLNTSSPSTILHIVGKCANDTMRLESSASCPTGVALTLYHNPSNGSQVGDYPATISLAGRNSNGQQINYAQIKSRILGTDINATSGELFFSVDVSGVSTNILTTNPKNTTIGLGASSTNSNNITVGSLARNSGINTILVGHSSYVSGVSSADNMLLGHSTNYNGSGSLVASHGSSVVGSKVFVLGRLNTILASDSVLAGSSINASGSFLNINGFSNSASGTYLSVAGSNNNIATSTSGIVYGFANTITNNTGGIVVGLSNNISGADNIVHANQTTVTGASNRFIGNAGSVSGNFNLFFGSNNTATGHNNIILGDQSTVVGHSGILIGRNLSSTTDNTVMLGLGSPDIVISSDAVTINSGLRVADINIFGGAANSGLFYRNNRLGINTVPNNYVLDVSGSIRGNSIFVGSLRIGNSSSNGSVLVSDDLGNASWQPASTLQQDITSGLVTNSLVFYNGSSLVSTSGLNWSAASGVLFTANSNIIIPTGNGTVILNNSGATVGNAFTVKGSGQNNVFLVNASNNTIGINTPNPSYNLHTSGTARFYKDSLYFVEKNDNQFIFAYDIGPSSPNRLSITSSGVIIDQTLAGTIFPAHSYATTYPIKTTADVAKVVVWDNSDNKLKYTTTITAGFDSFNGSSDS